MTAACHISRESWVKKKTIAEACLALRQQALRKVAQ